MSGTISRTNQLPSSLKYVATPNIDDHQLSPEDFTTKGEPAPVNESEMMNQMDFKTQKLMELLNKSCERGPGFTASLVMTTW